MLGTGDPDSPSQLSVKTSPGSLARTDIALLQEGFHTSNSSSTLCSQRRGWGGLGCTASWAPRPFEVDADLCN